MLQCGAIIDYRTLISEFHCRLRVERVLRAAQPPKGCTLFLAATQDQKETAPPSTGRYKQLKHENHNHVLRDLYSLYWFKIELSADCKNWNKAIFNELQS